MVETASAERADHDSAGSHTNNDGEEQHPAVFAASKQN
jgi:hypothetical protein